MKRQSTYTTAIAFILLFAMILTGCATKDTNGNSKGTNKEIDTIKIGYQKGNTLHILKLSNRLEERLAEDGVKVEWLEFPIGTALLEGLNTGAIDFGHASDANGVFSQASGKPSIYVASETPYPTGVAIVVKESSSIQQVTDLKGKKIGVTKGGNMHYLLDKALEKEGLTIDDVEPIYYKDSAEGRMAFESDRIDAIGTWDPFLAVLESTTATRTIVNGENLTQNRTFYFGSESFVKNHANYITILLEQLQLSNEWANDHTAELAAQLSKDLKIDVEPLEIANGRRTFGVLPINDEAVQAQQDLADTFYKLKLFPEPVDITSVTIKDADWYPESIGK